MAQPPSAQDVLDFLTAHGFSTAASALRDDLAALAADLPPLRTAPPHPHPPSTATSTSSSDAFLSTSSSPFDLINPYGLCLPPHHVGDGDGSSDEYSQFGTARQCDDGFNVFGNTAWYDGGVRCSPGDSEDKFVMSVEDRERLRNRDGENYGVDDKDGCVDKLGCLSPLCESCGGEGVNADRAGKPSSSVYVRYRIMPDETEVLDECEEDLCQLKLIDALREPDQGREKMTLPLAQVAEEEFGMLSGCAFEDGNLTNGHLKCESKTTESLDVKESLLINAGDKVLRKEDYNVLLLAEKASQPDVIKGHKLGACGQVDKKPQYTGTVGDEDEDHEVTDELQFYNSHEDEYEIFDLRIVHRKNRTGFEENKDFPIIINSVIAGRYYVTEYLGSAAFSKVVQAHDLQTGIDVCLKIIKNDKDFFDQSLDEIKLLKFVNKYDPADECHILRLYDYFYHQEHLFIVCELLRENLYECQKYNQDSGGEMYFTLPRIQAIARQCLEALEYLHHLRIIHCDLKPENILIKSYSRCEVKIIDLGSSCFQTDNLCLYVQSRSYRAPEVILCHPYDQKIDIWSLGCVLAELYSGDVLFPNESLVMMLARMIGILGPIDMEMLEMGQETHKYFTDDCDLYHRTEETDQVEYLIPEKSSLAQHLKVSDATFVDFLDCLLQINPKRRPTASQALQHHWLSFSY